MSKESEGTQRQETSSGNSNGHDVAIVGGGPAGLTAAIYAQRALWSTVVVEKAIPGGQLNETDIVENYPGFQETIAGPELVRRMRLQAERLGATVVHEDVLALRPQADGYALELTEGIVHCQAVIVSSGARPRELPAQGARQLKGKGVSYCATCDGFFFQDKDVVEVGAGEAGLTEALLLSRYASSVGIVIRHPQDDPQALRASRTLQQRVATDPKVYYIWDQVVDEVVGDKRVTGVVLKDCATGARRHRAIDGVFVNIGHSPETSYLNGNLTLDSDGYVLTDAHHHTNLPGVLAAGDVRSRVGRYSQAVIAAGDGAVAALEADRYLSGRK